MAFSATETSQIFLTFGIPQDGSVTIPHQLVGLWGPYQESYDLSAVVTALTARIAVVNANAAVLAMCQAVLTQIYTTIDDTSVLAVNSDGGTSGTLVDDPRQLEKLRQKLATLMGFYCPKGGFVQEVNARFGSRGGRVVRG